MDGNRRFARARGQAVFAGHRAGLDKLKELVEWCAAENIGHVVVYAFSTENWRRTARERQFLFSLFRRFLEKEVAALAGRGVRLRFIGQRERFAKPIQSGMIAAEEKTRDNRKINLWVALSYGGRAEILAAINSLPSKRPIGEDQLAAAMWSAGMPDPELIIRTGGDQRLSNFLLWQAAYSELFFTDTLWPAFSEREFKKIIADFYHRERRHGR